MTGPELAGFLSAGECSDRLIAGPRQRPLNPLSYLEKDPGYQDHKAGLSRAAGEVLWGVCVAF